MHPLHVGIVPHVPYALAYGGLELQQDRTIEALRALGVMVDQLDPWKRMFDAQLMHVFGSEYHQAAVIERAHTQGIPLVVTSMFMMMQPRWRFRLWRAIDRVLPPNTQRLRRRNLQAAKAVIAINAAERQDLIEIFDVDPSRIHVIPNGVEEYFFHATPDLFMQTHGVSDMVLCVGMVEPRKNQLALIEATASMGIPVVIVGPPFPNDLGRAYAQRVAEAVKRHGHVTWIPGIDHDDPMLASAYAAAAIHVLPSTAEAQGIVTLEAAAAGARVVVSDLPSLRSIFGTDVIYTEPTSVPAIRAAIERSMAMPRPGAGAVRPSWLLTWTDVARRTIDVYRGVLDA